MYDYDVFECEHKCDICGEIVGNERWHPGMHVWICNDCWED